MLGRGPVCALEVVPRPPHPSKHGLCWLGARGIRIPRHLLRSTRVEYVAHRTGLALWQVHQRVRAAVRSGWVGCCIPLDHAHVFIRADVPDDRVREFLTWQQRVAELRCGRRVAELRCGRRAEEDEQHRQVRCLRGSLSDVSLGLVDTLNAGSVRRTLLDPGTLITLDTLQIEAEQTRGRRAQDRSKHRERKEFLGKQR